MFKISKIFIYECLTEQAEEDNTFKAPKLLLNECRY